MGHSLSQNIRGGDVETSTGVNPSIEPVARPLAAVLFCRDHDPTKINHVLSEICGPINAETEPFPFDQSEYYKAEMGSGLLKYYLVFKSLISPVDIIQIKHKTSRLEWEYSFEKEGERRRVFNIDPGYFTHAQLILATHKNYSHRITLGLGVYAELTYLIQGKEWITLPWTYPDYCQTRTRDFFIHQRNNFVKETKHLRPPPASRIPMWQWEKSNLRLDL